MKLRFILNCPEPFDVASKYFSSHDQKRAAQFWCGRAAKGLRQQDFAAALRKAFENRAVVAQALAGLSSKEREVLGVVARFGTGICGSLLAAELTARKLTTLSHQTGFSMFYARRSGDVAAGMLEKQALLTSAGDSGAWEYSQRAYPDIRIPQLVAELATPAAAIPWPSAGAIAAVSVGEPRSTAEVALDLLKVAEALRGMKGWQMVRGGMLSKNAQKKIAKVVPFPVATDDPLALPDPWAFYYEMLRGFGFLNVDSQTVRDAKLQDASQNFPCVQAWNHVRVWLNLEFWQDGTGIISPSNRFSDPRERLDGRSLVVWALCRVAQSPQEWFDLEAFLIEFYRSTRLQPMSWGFRAGSWTPRFDRSRNKEKLPGGDERTLAYWLDQQGAWVANVVMITFVALGLIERGHVDGHSDRLCFRLTPIGRAVFGGPEIDVPELPLEPRFLAVLPNHDVLAYLDTADSRSLDMLTRIAECTSTSGKVQTFAIRRDYMYRALESGRTLAGIRTYLEDHSRTPLPDTVDRALTEWASKRDSLVVRSGVTVAVDPAGELLDGRDLDHRRLGSTSAILARLAEKEASHPFGDWLLVDHSIAERRTWTVTEMGLIQAEQIDSVSRVRLSLFTEQTNEGWQVTRESIRRALQQRLSVDQIFKWLTSHLTHAIPLLLKTAIRNWANPDAVFLGKVHVLQIPHADACMALLASPTFLQLAAEHIAPHWFVIPDENWAKIKKLLLQLGFAFSDTWLPRAAQRQSDDVLAEKIAAVHAARGKRRR